MNKERKMSLWLETIKLNRRSSEMFLAIILRRNKEQHLTCIDTEVSPIFGPAARQKYPIKHKKPKQLLWSQ
jgi:hypothetical protein